MKALAKERDRRYDSAIGLANDVERFLNDEPVTAGPPTARYRTAKFIRRHRGQVVAASLVVLALVGGIVGTTLGPLRGPQAARTGPASRWPRRSGRERPRPTSGSRPRRPGATRPGQRQMAERRSAQLGKVNEILGSIFRDLDLNQAEQEGKPVVIAIGERLDQASAALEGESIGDPLTVARMQMTLGKAQLSLGNHRKAVNLLERARAALERRCGPDDPTTLSCSAALAWAHDMDGHLDRATALLEPVVAAMRAKLGPDHPDTLRSMSDPAGAYADAGDIERAATLDRACLDAHVRLGRPESIEMARAQASAGSRLLRRGSWAEAEPMLRESLATREAIQPDAWATDAGRSLLGEALIGLGRFAEARPLGRAAAEALGTSRASA